MKKFIVVKFNVNGECVKTLDYPKNDPLPMKGDKLTMFDTSGNVGNFDTFSGIVTGRIFNHQKEYSEIIIFAGL